MNLGTFTKDENGVITGTATTLLSSFEIEYVPTTEKKGNAPREVYEVESVTPNPPLDPTIFNMP